MPKSNEIVHAGVLGMRWGKRKNYTPNADQAFLTKIKKTPISKVSDKDLAEAIKRQRLLNDFQKRQRLGSQLGKTLTNEDLAKLNQRAQLEGRYNSGTPYRPFSGKSKKLSDADLNIEITRDKLKSIEWKYGLKKDKPIKKMSPDEVAARLKRASLELQYKAVKSESTKRGRDIVRVILNYADDLNLFNIGLSSQDKT